ncbi:MFS transporter [Rhodoferax fermentans]|uniref:MFS transporter n=1 Tax=Rhodoferax fermentans TaxID=28066 RepID=A0A1T1AN08_RHOFE|nr:MFS transporter [Rhodoferax fermentans]MBK1684514.1 MFS transporter [Rhodoferax fermentans]OOV05536.1 MFS transporter [Rhodoferax fermentans]
MKTTHASHQAAVLAIIVTSYLMLVVDISIVLTGLPNIQAELGFSHAALSWVQNAYTLTFGGFLLLGARAGDILERRRMFIVGLALFTAASMAIGLAPSPTWLLLGRAIQGIGAAILAPSTLALISIHFAEGHARTRALALYAAAAGVGASLGLVLGGLVAELISWRVGFFINLPIGIALIVGAKRYLVETPLKSGRLDLAGAVSSTLGMGALVFGIVRSAESGWADTTTGLSVVSGLVLLVFFVAHESRALQPILPLHLFTNRERNAAYAARMLFLGGMVGFWFFTTQFLQGVLLYKPLHAGLAFLPTTIPHFIAAMSVPRLTRRFGNARLLAFGLSFCIAGLVWMAGLSELSSYVTGIALPMVLIGIGQGFALGPLTVSAVQGVASEDAGAVSGIVNVAHQVGGSLGLSILVVVFAAGGAADLGAAASLAHHIASTFTASALMLAIALALVLFFIVRPRARYLPA